MVLANATFFVPSLARSAGNASTSRVQTASLLPRDNVTTHLGVVPAAGLLARDYLTVRRQGESGVPPAPQAAE